MFRHLQLGIMYYNKFKILGGGGKCSVLPPLGTAIMTLYYNNRGSPLPAVNRRRHYLHILYNKIDIFIIYFKRAMSNYHNYFSLWSYYIRQVFTILYNELMYKTYLNYSYNT